MTLGPAESLRTVYRKTVMGKVNSIKTGELLLIINAPLRKEKATCQVREGICILRTDE